MGRYDDIYSSFVWQRFLFNNNLYAHVGEAINRQDRGKRNDLIDLANEVEGYHNAYLVWEQINQIQASHPLEFIKELIKLDNPIIMRHREFFQAYLKDLEKII